MIFKKKVLVRAPVLTVSGYGVHSRQVFEWAISRPDFDVDVQALPWGVTPWLINPEDKNGLVSEIMKRTIGKETKQKYDITFQVQLPSEWDPNLGRFNVGITAAVETDICNPEWISACNKMNAVIVPSTHTERVLRGSGETLKVPVFVVPESFHPEIAEDNLSADAQIKLDLGTKFNFLVFGQLTGNNPENDRKNLFYTVKWICEEFKNDQDVGLIIKTNSGRSTKIDKLMTERLLNELITQVRSSNKFPKTYFLHGNMTEQEVASLYRHESVKALVSLTRGEGFGLPLLEAAASGLPVIATGWSGHTDFLGLGKYITIDPILSPVHSSRIDGNIFVKGSRWANVDEFEVKSKLRKFYNKPAAPTQWAKELSGIIREKYSIDAVKKYFDEVIGVLGC